MSEHVNDTELLRASLFGLPKPTPRLRLHQISLRGDRPDFLDRLREAFRDESASYAAIDALMHVDYATIERRVLAHWFTPEPLDIRVEEPAQATPRRIAARLSSETIALYLSAEQVKP